LLDRTVGTVVLTLTGPDGKVKERREIFNAIVQTGKNHIASRLVGVDQAPMGFMALGSGGAATAIGDLGLDAELGRVALTSYAAAVNVVSAVATFPPGTATGTLAEAGLFNLLSGGGVMLARTTFSGVVKAAGDTLTVNWTVTIN
jgi:hypothetical protein